MLRTIGASRAQAARSLERSCIDPSSLLWTAPELLAGRRRASRESDVYSFGALVHECHTRRPPFDDADDIAAAIDAVRFQRANVPVPEGCSVQVGDL